MKRKVLNLGSGLKLFPSRRDLEIINLDREKFLEDCAKKVGAKFIVGDAAKLPFPSEYFDVVMACNILEHFTLHQVEEVLAGIWWVLRPSGFLYLVVPNLFGILDLVKARPGDVDIWKQANYAIYDCWQVVADHKCFFTQPILREMLVREGFEMVDLVVKTWDYHCLAKKVDKRGRPTISEDLATLRSILEDGKLLV